MIRKITKYSTLIILIFIVNSCANFKANYSNDTQGWENDTPPKGVEPEHRMYLIGDAGNAKLGKTMPVLKYVGKQLKEEGENSSIIYLGDNIYHDGMPDKNDEERELAEHRLNTQLEILDDFKGQPLFIPGNHDWRFGIKGVRRQEKYIEKYLNKGLDDEADDWNGDYFLPNGGCPGPEIIELNENLVIIAVDSQWWLADWDKEPYIHEGCEVRNKLEFKFAFENAVRKYRSKNVVIAMHHPLETVGTHGGKYTWKPHLFPLTEKGNNAYIPMPGIGSLYVFIRSITGSKQDIMHQEYKNLKTAILASVQKNGNFIFAAGHDHNLQYHEADNQTYIVSGAGSKLSPTGRGASAKFAYGTRGYSTIEFFDNGEAWTKFWSVNEEGTEAKVVFQKKIKEALQNIEENIPTEFPEYKALKNGQETVTTRPSRTQISDAGGFQKAMLGQHYRDVYLQEYEFPTLDMETFKGGVQPVKRGGGNQTNSLRVETEDGQQYVFRDLTKDVTRLLPPPFNKMDLASFIATDNFLSTHPFAPGVVPQMAEAINIYHTNPEFYYIPKQPRIGVNNDIFGNSVYLVEERPGGNWEGQNIFGGPEKFLGTADVVGKLTKNHNHKVDQNWTLRTRLFDFVIGDWDRHDDQWRWSRFEEGDKKVYRPIPRDRDQVFSKYDGFVTRWVTLLSPFTHQLAVYKPTVGKIKWAAWSPRNFDTSFLNEMEWEDWEKETKFIQENLTDEVIEKSFETWPKFALEKDGNYIKSTLKARRDNLMDTAERYFEFRSKRVDVVGTEGKDLFEIIRKSNEETVVRKYNSNKDFEKQELMYERTFNNSITKEVHIYGLGDDDKFIVKGDVRKSLKIRCVGGLGHDVFVDESRVQGFSNKTFFYDDERKNTLELGTEAVDKRKHHAITNIYDRRASHYEYGYTVPFPIFGSNPDDGFFLGASIHNTSYKFQKAPYGSIHSLSSTFAFATNAFTLDYGGDFNSLFGHWDLLIQAGIRNNAFSFNYFGFGNNSQADFDNEDGIDFYRTKQSQISFFPALKKSVRGENGYLAIGPTYTHTKIPRITDRFIGDLPDETFEGKSYGGIRLDFNFLNVDDLVIPHRGVNFIVSTGYRFDMFDSERSFGDFNAELSFYQNLDIKENLVVATRWGGQHNFGDLGDDFEFWQAPYLGGRLGHLRGYRGERFRGNTAYWQNIDLRLKLFSSYNRALPFTFGIFGGFDYGRVWVEDNDELNAGGWHYDYGGGIWIAPVDLVNLTFGVFIPKEDTEEDFRFTFKGGFSF